MPTDDQSVTFLEGLVGTPSTSGNEHAAVSVLCDYADRFGLASSIDGAGNGIAVRGDGGIEILLLGHIDTVPGLIPVRIEQGTLHGRGSVDAKGPLAAMLVAAARATLPPQVRVRVVAAVGEETPFSPGARFLLGQPPPAACIIGEPSGVDGVTLGYKGRLLLHAEFAQDSAHSAGPGGSACDAGHSSWMKCLHTIELLNRGHAGAFDTIQATLRKISSSSDGLVDTCSLTAGFRLPLWIAPEDLQTRLTEELGAAVVRFEGHERAHASTRNDPVARALSTAIRDQGMRPRPTLKTGTSDMNVVAPVWRCPIAAYGPGDSALDHTPHEHLRLDDFLQSISVLTRTIELLAEELAPATASLAR